MLKHGAARRAGKTGEYTAWRRIAQKCYNPKSHNYAYYGGRGITMSDRWLGSFENFLADMGERPSPFHSLERVDNEGHYSPDNCRWATREDQANNKRNNRVLVVGGVSKTMTEWSRETGIGVATLWARVSKLGWDSERAVSTPVRPKSLGNE